MMQTAKAGLFAVSGVLLKMGRTLRVDPSCRGRAWTLALRSSCSGGARSEDDGDVTLADLEQAAHFARIDVGASGDGERLLMEVRKALRSFRTMQDVPVDDVEPLHNMADFLAKYRASEGLEDARGSLEATAVDDGALSKHTLSREELLSLSNASIRNDQYHLPRS